MTETEHFLTDTSLLVTDWFEDNFFVSFSLDFFLCHEIIINHLFITGRLQVRATVAVLLVSSEATEHSVLVSFTQVHTHTWSLDTVSGR